MTRKWLVCILLPLALFAFYGCAKKAPVTPEEVVEAPPPPKPMEEVEPPPEPVVQDEVEVDPLDSADMREVNAAAIEQGWEADVYFDFDKSDLRPEAREALSTNARWLRAHPEFILTIEGHCDERGTNEYNLALGERRANAAKDYMASLNVDSGRLETHSGPRCEA